MIKINITDNLKSIESLRAGNQILLSGHIYTLRDAGHKLLVESIKNGKPDFNVMDKAFYYCGPSPAKSGEVIGSCGPTTSARMDDYTPFLLNHGLKIMIGKGKRSDDVITSMIKNKAVYLLAVGGAAALYKSCVTENIPVLYPHLGCEEMRRLNVIDMPLIVGIDANGTSVLN